MLTRLSDFLRKHEPITKLLMRLALLAILACVALDFHYIALDVSDIAARFDQVQVDLSALRDDIENGDDAPDEATSFERIGLRTGNTPAAKAVAPVMQ